MKSLHRNFNFGNTMLVDFINLSDRQRELVRNWRNRFWIKRWMYSDEDITKKMHYRFIRGLKRDDKNFYWLVQNKIKRPLGVVCLNRVNLRHRTAYLGVYKNPDFKEPGFGSVLMKCLKKIAFNKLGLHTLKLEVVCSNRGAIKFYKNEGFNREGVLKRFFFREGRREDVIIMGINNPAERRWSLK